MLQQQRLNSKGEKYVIGPTGAPLTLSDLPPANTQRGVLRRKAEVVAAVRGGLLSLDDACMRYSLTHEEFLAWQKSIDRHAIALRPWNVDAFLTASCTANWNVLMSSGLSFSLFSA